MKNILVFDVESTSLHGEGFAVGAMVGTHDCKIIDRFQLMATLPVQDANDWVKQNVLPNLKGIPECYTATHLRTAFYNWYQKHKENCVVFSDVNFPVETNFLSKIVYDFKAREFEMPYPLYDVVNFVDVNIDRAQRCKGLGIRKHHPLDDAFSSYYCLIDSPLFQQQKEIILK